MKLIQIILLSLLIMSCVANQSKPEFDLQGHRGTRGLAPENTIPAFLKAVGLGVDTVELDVVITKDRKVLISHDPWFNHAFSTKPDGSPVTEEEEMDLNIYEMTYEETQQFDVGKCRNPAFPRQKTVETTKPLLSNAIRAVEKYTKEKGLMPVNYNIEIKSRPDYYDIYVPQPDKFAELLNDVLVELDQEFHLQGRIIIQSFDPVALEEFRKLNPNVDFSMLVSDDQQIQNYIDLLGFTPGIWSPNYQSVTSEMITEAHAHHMKVIPWTVDTVGEMRNLLELGVDGIITDYPDSASVLK